MRTQECRKHIRKTGAVCHLKEGTMDYVENIMDFCEKHPEISTLSTDAVKTLMKIPDPEIREKALSTVGNTLNRKTPTGGTIKKRLTKPEVEKAIKKVLPPENMKKKSGDGKPPVSPKVEKPVEPVLLHPELKKPASPFQPAPESIPVTDAPPQPSLAERMKGEDDKKPEVPEVVTPPVPERRKAPCLSGQPCPDGQDHCILDGKGRKFKCRMWNQIITQMVRDECYIDVKARNETEKRAKESALGFTTGLDLAKPKPVNPLIIKPEAVTKEQFDKAFRGYFTPKTVALANELINSGQTADDYAGLVDFLICEACERMGAT